MLKVSIIIPVYNVEKYLPRCLDSACAQILQDIEIICINDGSTDNSGKILRDYAAKDARLKVISQKNGGYGKAVNAGLKAASGEYVAILESDDWADSEMYETLYNLAAAQNLDVIKADYYLYWSDGRNKIVKIGANNYNQVFQLSPQEYVGKIWGSIWSALYRRKFLLEHDIWINETAGASYQDTAFIFKTNICAQRIYLLEKAFLHYRQDNLQSSVKNLNKIFCLDAEYDELDRYLENHDLSQWQNLAMLRRCEGVFWNMNRLTPEGRRTYIAQQKDYLLGLLTNKNLALPQKRVKKLRLLQFSEKLFYLSWLWRDIKKKLKEKI